MSLDDILKRHSSEELLKQAAQEAAAKITAESRGKKRGKHGYQQAQERAQALAAGDFAKGLARHFDQTLMDMLKNGPLGGKTAVFPVSGGRHSSSTPNVQSLPKKAEPKYALQERFHEPKVGGIEISFALDRIEDAEQMIEAMKRMQVQLRDYIADMRKQGRVDRPQ